MKKKAIFASAVVFIIICAALSAQKTESSAGSVFGEPFVKPSSFKEFARQTQFFFAFEPAILINTADSKTSAPSPVVYPLSIGIKWPRDTFVSFVPRLSFFTNYYLWDGSKALPAEVENRTATSLSFLFDLPAAVSFRSGEKDTFELSGGIAALARINVLSTGVSGSDSGSSGSASGDVDKINSYFQSGARWLYLETHGAWLHQFTESVSAGPELCLYFPCGSLFSGDGLDAMLISAGIRFAF